VRVDADDVFMDAGCNVNPHFFTEHFRDVDVAFKTDVRGYPGSTNAVRKKKPPRRAAFARGSNSNQFDSGDGNDG